MLASISPARMAWAPRMATCWISGRARRPIRLSRAAAAVRAPLPVSGTGAARSVPVGAVSWAVPLAVPIAVSWAEAPAGTAAAAVTAMTTVHTSFPGPGAGGWVNRWGPSRFGRRHTRCMAPPIGQGTGRRGGPWLASYAGTAALLQSAQQCVVVGGCRDALDEPFHRRLRRHLLQSAAERVDPVQLVGPEELVLSARSAGANVDRGIDPLLGETPIELDLAVAGAFELLEDHVVHPRAGFDKRGGDDGDGASAHVGGDGSRRAEERLGLGHGGGVESAGQCASGASFDGVVSACEPCDGVEYDDDIASHLHEPAGALENHIGHIGVAFGGHVEARRDDLAIAPRDHLADFLGPLIDEEHEQDGVGVIHGHAFGDGLQQHRFAGASGRDDQGALAVADRRDEVDRAPGELGAGFRRASGFECEFPLGVRRDERAEIRPACSECRVGAVDLRDIDDGHTAALVAADRGIDGITATQCVLAHDVGWHVRVARLGQVACRGAPHVAAVPRRVEPAGGLAVGYDWNRRSVMCLGLLVIPVRVAATAVAPAVAAVRAVLAAAVVVMTAVVAALRARPVLRVVALAAPLASVAWRRHVVGESPLTAAGLGRRIVVGDRDAPGPGSFPSAAGSLRRSEYCSVTAGRSGDGLSAGAGVRSWGGWESATGVLSVSPPSR